MHEEEYEDNSYPCECGGAMVTIEVPSMLGYGTETYLKCSVCGKTITNNPLTGECNDA